MLVGISIQSYRVLGNESRSVSPARESRHVNSIVAVHCALVASWKEDLRLGLGDIEDIGLEVGDGILLNS